MSQEASKNQGGRQRATAAKEGQRERKRFTAIQVGNNDNQEAKAWRALLVKHTAVLVGRASDARKKRGGRTTSFLFSQELAGVPFALLSADVHMSSRGQKDTYPPRMKQLSYRRTRSRPGVCTRTCTADTTPGPNIICRRPMSHLAPSLTNTSSGLISPLYSFSEIFSRMSAFQSICD